MAVIDENEIRKTIALMKPDGRLFEVRIIYNDSKKTTSGYFRDAEKLITELKRIKLVNCNVYITINYIDAACYDRLQKDKFIDYPKVTTSDNDITGYEWLLIDLDPKRPSGTSSTNEQLENAKELANRVYKFMKSEGFEKPIIGMSGNGCHLMYRVSLSNTPENKSLMEKSLKSLDMIFSNNIIDVDTSVFNQARISKLYGTLAQKGTNSEDRPHRMSRMLSSDPVKVNDKKLLEKLSSYLPSELKPEKSNGYNPSEFDVEDWMSKYGLRYQKSAYSNGIKYILDCCPFDSNHKGKDACIFRSTSGAIGFHCFHNSCSDKTWQDVRMIYEPDAYNKQYVKPEKTRNDKAPINDDRIKVDEPIFFTPSQIRKQKKKKGEYIKTGITDIDKRIIGLRKGCVSVLTGLSACGKSSILSQITAECVDQGYKVALFSGELTSDNTMDWIYKQMAGKGFVKDTQYENYFIVEDSTKDKIDAELEGNLLIYNNNQSNKANALTINLESAIVEQRVDLILIDNLMAVNLTSGGKDKYEAQSEFVQNLHLMAQRYNVHVFFVAHPRKPGGIVRFEDISGSFEIMNWVDNAFIMHRINDDFKRNSVSILGWHKDDERTACTNIIETVKNREFGIQDVFTPLFFEQKTKRLRNSISDNKVYKWNQIENGFEMLPEDAALPFM